MGIDRVATALISQQNELLEIINILSNALQKAEESRTAITAITDGSGSSHVTDTIGMLGVAIEQTENGRANLMHAENSLKLYIARLGFQSGDY